MTRKACVFVGALAALALGLSGCAQPMSRSQKGAAIGAVSGRPLAPWWDRRPVAIPRQP